MSKHRVVILKIVANQLTVTEAAAQYGISRRHLHRLLARYRQEGIDAVEPQSRRPRSNSAATPQPVRARIVALRQLLQQHERARPMAGLFVTHVATHLRHMSRLITLWSLGESNS